MTFEPVSRPYQRHQATVTGGRPLPAHLVAQPKPQLGEEAGRLLAVAAAGKLNALKFAEAMLANPSAAGAQALAHLAWSIRQDAQKKLPADAADSAFDLPNALENAAKKCAALVQGKQSEARLMQKVAVTLVQAYEAGVGAGEKKAHKEQATVEQPIRRTEFVTDETGNKIVGKIEYELKPGGNK